MLKCRGEWKLAILPQAETPSFPCRIASLYPLLFSPFCLRLAVWSNNLWGTLDWDYLVAAGTSQGLPNIHGMLLA